MKTDPIPPNKITAWLGVTVRVSRNGKNTVGVLRHDPATAQYYLLTRHGQRLAWFSQADSNAGRVTLTPYGSTRHKDGLPC